MRKILLIVIVALLLIWTANAGLSDWFFCQVRSTEVVISLKKAGGFYRCSDTVASLEKLIMQTARDLMNIQTYINSWRDRDYRIGIKAEKLSLLEKYQTARKNILKSVETFQNNLVQKSVYYFILSITPYKLNLQRSLNKIEMMTGTISSSLSSYASLLKDQIATISSLSASQTVAELIPLLKKYIYLKNEISWKYE